MASMNFNTIGQQQLVTQQSKPLVLREGQVFRGSIKQHFPNQIAEIQVGSNKLVAKLETPLKAGDSHYFQVMNTNGQVELKIVSGPNAQATPAQQMTQLMESMNLPKSAEMRQVLSYFIQQNTPIAKEQLLQAEAWLKEMPNQATKAVALQALSRMIELKMPFTNNVFKALMHGSKSSGVSDALSTLMQRITQDTQVNPVLKASIQNQIQTIQQPLMQQVGANVLATAVNTLLDSSALTSNKLESLLLLKQAGIVQQQSTITSWMPNHTAAPTAQSAVGQLITQLSNSQPANIAQTLQNVQTTITQEQSLQPEQKAQLNQMLERFTQMPKTRDSIEQFTRQFSEQLLKVHATNQLTNPSHTNEQGLLPKDQLLSLLKVDHASSQPLTQLAQLASNSQSSFIQTVSTDAELTLQANMDSKQIEQAMKTVLRSFGLSYEAMLGSNKADYVETVMTSLKPQLMNLMIDSQTSLPVRDAAEVVLARLNGMQLLSTDNGYQHQIVMQVPLDFLGKRMEATLHWNGRLKDDGKIDSDYARILFYLQMQSIQETVIDMQVQSRIVSVTVYNENLNLQPLAVALKEVLAVGLEQKGYQLSGVQFKSFEQQHSSVKKDQSTEQTSHSGVDIRV